MKKYLVAAVVAVFGLGITAASAADSSGWKGFYLGANLGYSWGKSDTSASFYNNTTGALLSSAGSKSFDMDGWLGGLQLGYNWQMNSTVLGVEADIQWTGQKGNTTFNCAGTVCNVGITAIPAASAPVNVSDFSQKLSWFATFRPRIGVLVTPSALAYVTGGLVVGGVKTDGTLTGYTAGGAATSSTFSSSKTKAGWTIGAGVEAKLWDKKWTGKIEYLYIDLGSVDTTATLTTNFIPIRADFSSKITDNILRVGLNYQF